MHLRLKVLTFGASIAGLGAFALVSAARLQVIGVRSTATFIDYTDVCSLDDPSVGLFESIRPFNCDESDTRRRPGVGVTRDPGVHFQYRLADNNVRDAWRRRQSLGNPNMDRGQQFAIIYDPAEPDDVRVNPSPVNILICLLGTFAGVGIMFRAIGVNIFALFRAVAAAWHRATGPRSASRVTAINDASLGLSRSNFGSRKTRFGSPQRR